ncbi:putative peptidoglycan glycosyltransferase FtsW [Luteolibacter sp. LG18]|uniref:FtsW/RodA/SpoVE family cell cycle protein n=1 Tax=Luteolibacter sp. LG18 TaxID=2819286 RepID=UPI002B313217|nr:putative lipid II flippase FtsW [Luteolibacter sp. LG18]
MIRYAAIVLCIAVALLVCLGLVMLASTSAWVLEGGEPYSFVKKQALMVVVGAVLAIFAARVPDAPLRKLWPWALAAVCVLLVMCLIPGVGIEIYGSKRWVKMPVMGAFQPSELARVVGVIALAGWFARWQTETRTFWRGFILPGMIIGLPIGLIAIETDVGSALSMSMACATVFFCAGTRLRYLIPIAILGMTAAYTYVRHDPVRWSRIESWLDPENHQKDNGMQQWRALIAFGNGGPTGVGLGNGNEKFGNLTFAHIDFIFPEIGEELGLPATLGVVLCYVMIAVCGIGIAAQAKTVFARLAAIGLTCMIVVPAMQNIAVTTGCLPNDGLPLPFISYGGSSIVFALAAVGMLVGIHRRGIQEDAGGLVLDRQRGHDLRL